MLYSFLERTPKHLRHGALFINPLTKKAPKDIKKAWNTAKRKACLENFRFHDLRHTVATRLVNAGVPLPTVQIIMTHSDISTTMKYVHTPETAIFSAIEVLNSCNEGLIQND
jgi:integrase